MTAWGMAAGALPPGGGGDGAGPVSAMVRALLRADDIVRMVNKTAAKLMLLLDSLAELCAQVYGRESEVAACNRRWLG